MHMSSHNKLEQLPLDNLSPSVVGDNVDISFLPEEYD